MNMKELESQLSKAELEEYASLPDHNHRVAYLGEKFTPHDPDRDNPVARDRNREFRLSPLGQLSRLNTALYGHKLPFPTISKSHDSSENPAENFGEARWQKNKYWIYVRVAEKDHRWRIAQEGEPFDGDNWQFFNLTETGPATLPLELIMELADA